MKRVQQGTLFLHASVLVLLLALPAHAVVVPCATTSTTVSVAKNRIRLIMTNDSDVEICLNLNAGVAVVDDNLCLAAGDRAFFDEQTSMPRGAITCIHAGVGTKNLTVEEQVKQ